MRLAAEIGLSRGSLELDVALTVESGETLALVGPNGAGKSTCLQVLAGLLRIERGRITLGDRVLDGGPAGPYLPPEARRVGFVFQDHILFPRMTVLENVAYGPRSRGIPAREARALALEWLERVGMADRSDVPPQTLSGGQAQRVALARALATSPHMLLLDEPLASVDASARIELRRELRARLADFEGVRVVVAHDIGDALALAERLVVVEEGRVVQGGSLAQIVSRPLSRYVADLVGLNCFRGACRNGVVELEGGRLIVAHEEDGPVIVTVHPRAVAIYRERPAGSPRNVWAAPVLGLEPSLDRVRVQVGGALPVVAELTHAAVDELRLRESGDVWVAVKATEIAVTPA